VSEGGGAARFHLCVRSFVAKASIPISRNLRKDPASNQDIALKPLNECYRGVSTVTHSFSLSKAGTKPEAAGITILMTLDKWI
jgi:hypothetical protein